MKATKPDITSTAPLCPNCTLPVTGPCYIGEGGKEMWHLSCWERNAPVFAQPSRDADQYGLGLNTALGDGHADQA